MHLYYMFVSSLHGDGDDVCNTEAFKVEAMVMFHCSSQHIGINPISVTGGKEP